MNIIKRLLVVGILVAYIAIPSVSFAEGKGYVVMAEIGDIKGEQTLETYIPLVFKLLIGISAVFAVGMIIAGGLQYMTTDAIQGKSAGKARIFNSIYAFIFVVGAWLVLQTVNPRLLEFDLELKPIEAPGSESLTFETITSSDLENAKASDAYYRSEGNSSNPAIRGTPGARDKYDPKDPGKSCTSCRTSTIKCEAKGCKLDAETAGRLEAVNADLKRQGIPELTITEGHPPSCIKGDCKHHRANCHYDGSCGDVRAKYDSPAIVKAKIDTARRNGMDFVYETGTSAQREKVMSGMCGSDAGCRSHYSHNVKNYGKHVTAPHYSVYTRNP